MAQFTYKARNPSGELTTGTIEASDTSAAAQMLSSRNFIPVDIVEAKSESKKTSFLNQPCLCPKCSWLIWLFLPDKCIA